MGTQGGHTKKAPQTDPAVAGRYRVVKRYGHEITARADSDEIVNVGPLAIAPRRIRAVARDEALQGVRFTFTLEADASSETPQHQCIELTASRDADGAPITSTSLRRVRLGELYRAAVVTATLPLRRTEDGRLEVDPLADSTEFGEDIAAVVARQLEGDRTPRQGKRIGEDELRDVAAIYEANEHHAPTQAVMREFHIKKTAAVRRIRRAREYGYLPSKEDT